MAKFTVEFFRLCAVRSLSTHRLKDLEINVLCRWP